VRLGDLAIGILEDIGVCAVEHARPAKPPISEARGMASRFHALSASLDTYEPHPGIIPEGVEQADSVRASADARYARVRQPAGLGQDLLAGLKPDD
jgi:hypothetical protein